MLRKALALFFEWLYHRGAWSYDLVAAVVSLGGWQRWVRSVLPYLHTGRVLELGYGPGHLLSAMQQRGIPAYGLDASRHMARQAGRRLLRSGLRADLVVGYAQNTPFPSGAFEQIVATFPSEYLFQAETLRECHRLLSAQGELLILPMAWITAGGLLAQAAAALFRLTGQNAPRNTDWQAVLGPHFAAAGFHLHAEMLSLAGSTVLLLRARKNLSPTEHP